MKYRLNLEDYMDKELWQKISELSKIKGVTKEMLVVEAMHDYIHRNPIAPLQGTAPDRPPFKKRIS